MAYIRKSFYYDPIRQGYDTNLWKTISGAPAASGDGRLSVDNAAGIAGSCIHYVDFVKGDISFNVNVPTAPAEGVTRMFGVSAPNTSLFIRFSVGSTFQCQVSDGTNTSSSTVAWNSDWTGANVTYGIRWESGSAKFFINGTRVATISDTITLGVETITVPSGPLSLYLYDNADTSMTVGDIFVKGTQSYVLNPKSSDTTPYNPVGTLSRFQNVAVTENVNIVIPTLLLPFSGVLYEPTITVSENVVLKTITHEDFAEDITVTDVVVALYIPTIHVNVNEDITVSEDISPNIPVLIDLNDSVSLSENVDVIPPELVPENNDSVAVSEDVSILIPELVPEVFDSISVSEGEIEMTRVVGP